MSAFGGLKFTQFGLNLQAKAQIGTELQYTRIGIGDGHYSGDILDITNLEHQVLSLPITSLSVSGGMARIGSALSNQDLQTGFYLREIGIFATDPDEGEILYGYANAGDFAGYVPPGGGADPVEKEVELITTVGTAANVTAVIDTSVFVTLGELDEHADNTDIHVTPLEKAAWSGKQNHLGYTAENLANKGQPSGYASLGSDGLVPAAQLPKMGARTATVVVAAANSSAKSKAGADYIVPDGAVNAQVTIQAAITAISSSGGTVLLLEGIYTVSGPINLGDNVTLQGMGASTVIKLRNSHNTGITMLSDSGATSSNNQVVICDLMIDGNKINQTGTDIQTALSISKSYTVVRDIFIVNARTHGIYGVGSATSFCIVNNTVKNCGTGIQVANGNSHTIKDNVINDATSVGISVWGSMHNVASNKITVANGAVGIIVQGTESLIERNICWGPIGAATATYGISLWGANNEIIGNVCRNCDVGILFFSTIESTTVSTNRLYNNKVGIFFKGNNGSITNNNVLNSELEGIHVEGHYNSVQLNVIRKGTSTPTKGLYILNGTGNLVTNNDLRDSGTAAFTDAGTGTVTAAGNRT